MVFEMNLSQTVEIEGIHFPVYQGDSGWIPETKIILTPTARSNLKKILLPLLHGHHILLVGDAGVGKNALIYYVNSLRNHPTFRYSFNEDTLPEDLIGCYRIDPINGSFVWTDGTLTSSLRKGACFVADEMNLTASEILKRFDSVFTTKTLQLWEGDSSNVYSKLGFSFIATQNPMEGFEARKIISREIQKYFSTIYMDPLPPNEQEEILKSLYPQLDPSLIEMIVLMNFSVENLLIQRKIGTSDLERYHFNLRNMKRLASRLSLEPSHWLDEINDIYIRPFRNLKDQNEIQSCFQKIISKKHSSIESNGSTLNFIPEKNKKKTEIYIDSENLEIHIGRAKLFFQGKNNEEKDIEMKQGKDHICREFQKAAQDAFCFFPPVVQTLPVLEAIARCIQMKENILLESDSNTEPEDYVRFFGILLGCPVRVISFSKGMRTSDILGGLKPKLLPDSEQGFSKSSSHTPCAEWVDGPLVKAVRVGELILLKGLEAAGPELIEKFNMFLDDSRALLLPPESGEDKPLILHENSCIFAQKFFRTQRNTPSMSRAFRNRFTSIVIESISEQESLQELASHYMKLDPEAHRKILDTYVSFHHFMIERSLRRDIGSERIHPYRFGLTNFQRWCHHTRLSLEIKEKLKQKELTEEQQNTTQEKKNLEECIIEGVELAYTNEISNKKERSEMLHSLRLLMEDIPLAEVSSLYSIGKDGKKKIIVHDKKSSWRSMWWDQKKHYRSPDTGKFNRKLSGSKLKKGLNINTPETGGNQKEGPDAWYGSDTIGNKGQGEPSAGGGAWGYRTEEIYREFLKKRRFLWSYDLPITLQDFKKLFAPQIERVLLDFDRLFEPNYKMTRHSDWKGSRMDMRRYLSFLSGGGDNRVFDKTSISLQEDHMKGVEVLFTIHKSRRIFNFEYSLAIVAALMSSILILDSHRISYGISSYSDLSNQKESVDIVWYKKLAEELSAQKEEEVFNGLIQEWHGDSVDESLALKSVSDSFHPSASTRLLVILSDFRGFRGKVSPEQDLAKMELQILSQTVEKLHRQGIIVLGIGVGPRALARYLFANFLHIDKDNFINLPVLTASKLTELIRQHHTIEGSESNALVS